MLFRSGPVNPFYSYPTNFIGSGSPVIVSNLSAPGTYIIEMRRLVSNATNSCGILSDLVSVTTSIAPTASNAGSRQILACNVTNTQLAANLPFSGTGRWFQVAGPTTVTFTDTYDPTVSLTGLSNGVYTFRWLINGGPNCSTTQGDVSVIVSSAIPSAANAGPDQTVCVGSTVTLAANSPLRKETGKWTVSPSAGIVFSNVNSPRATVTGLLASTTYTFTWTISNVCGSTTDNVLITSNAVVGPVQSDAGADQCLTSGTTNTLLAANNPGSGTGIWNKISGGAATIVNPGLFNTAVTGLSDGIYSFEWVLTFNACAESRDTVIVNISNPVTTANAGPDQTICGNNAILSGNLPLVGTGEWAEVSGPPGWTIADPNSPTTEISGLIEGVYTFSWTISNGNCTSSTDELVLYISTPPSIANAGTDINLCGITSTTLAANAATAGSGVWSVLGGAPNTPTFSNVNSPTSGLSGLIQGTYNLRWTISTGGICAESFDDVVVSIVPTAVASANQSICNVSSVQLTGLPAGSTGTWTQNSGPPTTISTTGANTAIALGLIGDTYGFTYTIPAAGCSTSANTTVIISGPSTVADAGPDQDICRSGATATINLAGNTIVTGAGTWTKDSGPAGGTITTPGSPTTTVTDITNPGTYYYSWTSTNGTCSNTDLVRITVYLPPTTANAGSDQAQVCGPVATMAANNPAIGLGLWTQVSGPNTAVITSPILNNTTMTGLIAGDYTFRWTISNGPCSTSSDDVTITVFTAPTQSNAGPNQVLCDLTSATLAGNTITLGAGLWTQISGPNTAGITSPTVANSEITNLIPGVYVFDWTSTLAPCSSSDQVQITIDALPTTANAGTDLSICLFDPDRKSVV